MFNIFACDRCGFYCSHWVLLCCYLCEFMFISLLTKETEHVSGQTNPLIFLIGWLNVLPSPTPVLLPGNPHGWRSLVGYSPWDRWGRTQLSDFTFTFHFHALEKEMATHSSVLPWRIPGMGEPGGLPSMGSHRVRHDWSDLEDISCVFLIILLFWFSFSSFTPFVKLIDFHNPLYFIHLSIWKHYMLFLLFFIFL